MRDLTKRRARGACSCRPLVCATAETRNFIWALRLWLDGALGQNIVWSRLSVALGPKEAHRALREMETFIAALAACARRPIQRGPSGCPNLHEDEAAIGRMLRLAVTGDRARARREAQLLLCEGADEIVPLAATLGAAFAALGDLDGGASPIAARPLAPERRPEHVTLH